MHRSVKQNYSEFGEDKPREYWATIAIVAASAISAGSGAYSASQAGGGGAGGSRRPPNFVQPPEPAYERALRHYTTRLLAQGVEPETKKSGLHEPAALFMWRAHDPRDTQA